MEEDTPLATANITRHDSPSTRSKISSIETAVVPSSFEHSNKPTPKQFYFGQGQPSSMFTTFNSNPSMFDGIKKSTSSSKSMDELPERVINPVDSYSTYSTWLKMNFPEHINTYDILFINNILKLKSYSQAKQYSDYSPQEWKNMLGSGTYKLHLETIVTLMIIMNHTLNIGEPIPYKVYAEERDICYEAFLQDFGLYVDEDKPPKYTKMSPTVKKYEKSVRSNRSNKSGRTPKAYMSTEPKQIDSQGIPYIIKGGKPDDPGDMSSSSSSETSGSKSRRPKRRSTASRMAEAIYNYEHYGDPLPDKDDLDMAKDMKKMKIKLNDSDSVMSDRSKRNKPAKNRAKLDTLKWDGMSNSFRSFKTSLEGHLVQVGAGYMIKPKFIETYREEGIEYLKSKEFWSLYKVSMAQALHDREYLYGILLTATSLIQHKTIIKYQQNLDGISAWHELKEEFEYDGSKELRLEQLEMLIQTPYSNSETMARFIDKFQSYMAEIEAISPDEYLNTRKKRLLLASMKTASGVAHLIQKCRDSSSMTYEETARYLRSNSILIDNHNSIKPPSRLMKVEEAPSRREDNSMKTEEQVIKLFHTMAVEEGYEKTYNIFNTKSFRDSLRIPTPIWMELEPEIRKKIEEARKRVKEKRGSFKSKDDTSAKTPKKKHMDIPNQYPNVKPKTAMVNLMNSMNNIDLGEDMDSDSTDDEILDHSINMVRRTIPMDPPSDVIDVKAHFEYIDYNFEDGKIFAISDGGADSCIIGQNAKVLSYTGRFANLVGYDPENTRKDKVPIVNALIKVKTATNGNVPVLLKINEAPYNPTSSITLLSEYQIREYGLIIDSVAKKHFSAPNVRGKQHFQIKDGLYIDFEDRGGLMGFEILPFEQGDEELFEIIKITSPERWLPYKYKKANNDIQPYDPTDLNQEISDYPIMLNHTTKLKPNTDSGEIFELLPGPTCPLVDTQVYATTKWHRVIYQNINPILLRPYLGYRPIDVIKKTLEKTTQLARMIIRQPLRRHVKSRFPHLNVSRIDEPVSTDPMFSNCRSIYHGYIAAQVFYGTRSHTIFVYGLKNKGVFPKVYKDFIREQGAPSALRRDNAKEEQSEEVKEINREFLIKDQYTEPYHPQQNPVEAMAIRYIKGQISALLDITGAPDSLWYMAAQYVAGIHNICSDSSLPNEMTPLQYLKGVTPDISAYLQFTFWQPVLYLDHEAEWPSSKERSGRWVGLAQGIGDLLTFWILDDQSKHLLARSVVRPFKDNMRVKWDPDLIGGDRNTAKIADDKMPINYEKIDTLNEAVLEDHKVQDKPIGIREESILKPEMENPGLNTATFVVPYNGPTTRSKGKLKLDNQSMNIDESIKSFPRSKKKPYKEIKYKEAVIPKKFDNDIQEPRRSERIKNTSWTGTRQSLTVNGKRLLPTSIHALPSKGLKDIPLVHTKPIPLTLNKQHEELRAYHARLDLMESILNPDQSDFEWQVEAITDWTVKRHAEVDQIFLKVTWIGGNKQWISVNDMRLHDPHVIINYALRNNLTDKPGWEWTSYYLKSHKKLDNMVHAYKTSKFLKNIKFGVEVPQSTRHALKIDAEDGKGLWKKAMQTEINQLMEYGTFKVLGEKEPAPEGYKFIPYHCIYDVKFDGRRKCRLVAGGHMTEPSTEEIFSGVVSMETVRTTFVIARRNGLEVVAGDVGNAFLNGWTKEKVYFRAGPEFGPELEGRILIAIKAIYGLKSSSARFHEHLSAALKKLGFRPSKADADLWIKKVDNHYEYIARYVDDVIVFSKQPMDVIIELKKTYTMKDVGRPQYYLGGDVVQLGDEWEKEGISEALSAETYISNALPKLAKICGLDSFKKSNIPFGEEYHPELDESELLPPQQISIYQSLIGSANWIITLGRFDIAYAINTLSRYSMAPREGHLQAMKKVFGYLRSFPKGKILIDVNDPPIRRIADTGKVHDWIEFYPDATEDLPKDRPKARGELCTLTCYVDADHARDMATRRSVTGILVLLNNTPISWYSKRQKTVESATYGSELVASRIAVEKLISLRYFISMLGCNLEPCSVLLGDNMAVVLNTTIPSSTLKKKHQACNYHKVRESIAGGFIRYGHIKSEDNMADILTKPLSRIKFERLTSQYLFRRPKTVTENQTVQASMVYHLPQPREDQETCEE